MKLIETIVISVFRDMLDIFFNNQNTGTSLIKKQSYLLNSVFYGPEYPDHFVIGIEGDMGDDEITGGEYNDIIINKYGKIKQETDAVESIIPRYPEIFIYIAKSKKEVLEYFHSINKTFFVEIEQTIGPEGIYFSGFLENMPEDYVTQLPEYYNLELDKYLKDTKTRRIMFFKDPPYDFIEKGHNSTYYTEIHMVIVEPEYSSDL